MASLSFPRSSTASNRNIREKFLQALSEEKFDLALATIAKSRSDPAFQRNALKEYFAKLSEYLHKIGLKKSLPFGWLTKENADFADTVKVNVLKLGDIFFSALVEQCVRKNEIDWHLLKLFLELTQDNFLWTDVINLCLTVARVRGTSASHFDELYELLSNVRQFVDEAPQKSVLNPFMKEGEQNERMDTIFAGKPQISLSDVTERIVIAHACASISRCSSSSLLNYNDTERLFQRALEKRLYRDAVLLHRHCKVGSSAVVFSEFAKWVIRMTTLAQDQYDEFFYQVGLFIDQLDLFPLEKVWQREFELAEVYVQRMLGTVQGSLLNLYSELGTYSDLRAILVCYVEAELPIFFSLEKLLISARHFNEFLWTLTSLEKAQNFVYQYVMDWISSVEGKPCIATVPSFSLTGSKSVELPQFSLQLKNQVLQYFFTSKDEDIRKMGFILEEKLKNLDKENKKGLTEIMFRQKASYVEAQSESSEEDNQDQQIKTASDSMEFEALDGS